MNSEDLLIQIRTAFRLTEMPLRSEIAFHNDGCPQCSYLVTDIEDFRDKPVDGKTIRFLHQEMSCLSAKGWRWVMPYYLSFCLTPEAEYNKMETEFLIYNLGPDDRFKEDTLKRLSGLNAAQIHCLIHFMEWLKTHPYWSEYCPNNIKNALQFLRAIDA